MKLASFGEIIWDVYGCERNLGGAPLNICAHSSLYGFDAYLFSTVGDDELGKNAFGAVSAFGVKTDFIKQKSSLPTGRCNIALDSSGVPSYSIEENSAYDEIDAPDTPLKDFDVLSFGTLALRYSYNKKTLASIIKNNHFTEIYADLNIRAPYYSLQSVEFCLNNASIVKISSEEMPIVLNLLEIDCTSLKDAAKAIAKRFTNIKLLLITLGENGSFCFDTSSNKTYEASAVKTNVVSTVGAGDSFGAAFLASYLKNKDIAEALKIASHISAYVVSSMEAIPLASREVFESILTNKNQEI